MTPISASDIPLIRKRGGSKIVPKAATEEDIARIKQEFKTCAIRAKKVGFDGI